jgi:hypothetical protein
MMTPEQQAELMAQAPKEMPPEYLAVAHVYAAFLDGVNALGHAINHTLQDATLPAELREAGQAYLDVIKEPTKAFQAALEAAADKTASPEVREFSRKVNEALKPQVTLSEGGVLDFSNKVVSGMAH